MTNLKQTDAREFYQEKIQPNNADSGFLVPSWAVDFAEKYAEYKATFNKDSPYQGSAGVWRSDQAPELVDGKKAIPRHVIAEKKTHDGKTYKSKRVAYYFPECFKSVEFEDWDDYDPKDFPYTTQDEEKGVVWLKAGWYESVNCDRCDEYWSAPLDVIVWLDESISSPAGDGWVSVENGKSYKIKEEVVTGWARQQATAFAEFTTEKYWFDEDYRLWNLRDDLRPLLPDEQFRFTTEELYSLFLKQQAELPKPNKSV